MNDRPPKLPATAVNVVWASRLLNLSQKIVWYQDWCLDQGGPDGSYVSHKSMEARLGGSLTAGTIETTRQWLKRHVLHEPLRRRDARNLGWISTLPIQCVPRTYHDVAACAAALDVYLVKLGDLSGQDGSGIPDRVEPPFQTGQNPQAAALGARGDPSASVPVRQAQLPSAFRGKGAGARAPNDEKEEKDTKLARELRDRINKKRAAG